MTNEEKLALIKKHIEADRASSPDGKTSWDRVEDFRLKHGHLPSDSEAPCLHCFQERTEAKIEVQDLTTERNDYWRKAEIAERKLAVLEAELAAMKAERGQAYEIGALAMAHYYHGEDASVVFRLDHANRALREEHLEWAKSKLPAPPKPEEKP